MGFRHHEADAMNDAFAAVGAEGVFPLMARHVADMHAGGHLWRAALRRSFTDLRMPQRGPMSFTANKISITDAYVTEILERSVKT